MFLLYHIITHLRVIILKPSSFLFQPVSFCSMTIKLLTSFINFKTFKQWNFIIERPKFHFALNTEMIQFQLQHFWDFFTIQRNWECPNFQFGRKDQKQLKEQNRQVACCTWAVERAAYWVRPSLGWCVAYSWSSDHSNQWHGAAHGSATCVLHYRNFLTRNRTRGPCAEPWMKEFCFKTVSANIKILFEVGNINTLLNITSKSLSLSYKNKLVTLIQKQACHSHTKTSLSLIQIKPCHCQATQL